MLRWKASLKPTSGGGGGTVIFSDAMTEGADTILTSHTPDTGTAWVESVNTTTASNAYVFAATDTAGIDASENSKAVIMTVTPAPSGVNYDVELDVAALYSGAGTDDPMFVIGRYVDSSNFYAIQIKKNAINPNIELYKYVAGTATSLGTYNVNLTATDTLKLEIRDATKKVYINDVEQISSVDNALTAAGTAGWGVGSLINGTDDLKNQWQIDNFIVTEQ